MLLSDSLLHFFLPELKKARPAELENYLTSIQLEIVETWEPKVKNPHPLKVLSASLADEQKYRYELCSLKTGNIFYSYSDLAELDINKVVFVSNQSIPNNSVIEDKNFLAFSDIFEDRSLKSRAPKVVPIVIDSTDSLFEELLRVNFFFPTRFYRLKQIYKYCDFSTTWVVAQELSLPANIFPKKFDDHKLEEIFPNNSTGNLLISIFLKSLQLKVENNYQERAQLLVTNLFGEYLNFVFSPFETKPQKAKITSQVKLKKLLPIFSELKDNWEEQVVPRLSKVHFVFRATGFGKKKEEWEIQWPPWYFKKSLPPISELLVKLIPLDQFPILLGSSSSNLGEFNPYEQATQSRQIINFLVQIRSYLREKGFVECHSVKFIEKEKNFKLPSVVLTSNAEVSLRDHLHCSLAKVLIENLNQSNELYPAFELSFCPWSSIWKLGLAVVTNFALNKDEKLSPYNFSSLKKLVCEMMRHLFNKVVEFKELPPEERYISSWKATKIYRLTFNSNNQEEELGELLVFREEQLELRKKELISVNLSISVSNNK